MIRAFLGFITIMICMVFLTPVVAFSTEETTETSPVITPGIDVATLLLASRMLSLIEEDQVGITELLAEMQESGDITDAGVEKLENWLNGTIAEYTSLLTPKGSQGLNSTSLEQLPVSQQMLDETPASDVGIELSTDGSVRVQGVEQLIGMAGLGRVAEAASTAGVVLELDPKNVGVYIPITIDGTAVRTGQTQFDGVDDRLKEMLRSLKPDARIYTVPTAWKEDAGAAWNYICEIVTGKETEEEQEVVKQLEKDGSFE